jgi:hypothetical protein
MVSVDHTTQWARACKTADRLKEEGVVLHPTPHPHVWWMPPSPARSSAESRTKYWVNRQGQSLER